MAVRERHQATNLSPNIGTSHMVEQLDPLHHTELQTKLCIFERPRGSKKEKPIQKATWMAAQFVTRTDTSKPGRVTGTSSRLSPSNLRYIRSPALGPCVRSVARQCFRRTHRPALHCPTPMQRLAAQLQTYKHVSAATATLTFPASIRSKTRRMCRRREAKLSLAPTHTLTPRGLPS